MRVPRGVQITGRIALVAGLLFAGYVAYRILNHGPPALLRADVSVPRAHLRYGPAPQQVVDLRVPAGRGPFPVVLLVHGGCWSTKFGSAAYMAPLADALLRRGIATVNMSYRRVGEPGGGWPGTFRDVGAATDGIRSLAPRYGIDPTRLVVAGHSAGALLALWTAARDRLAPTSDLYAPRPLMPRAVVAIDGPGALARFIGPDAEICGDPAIVPLMGATLRQAPARYRDATPQDHLPLGVPQYLAVGGMKQPDTAYIAAARRSGDRVALYLPPPRTTHFDGLIPWQPQGEATIDLIVRAVAGTAAPAPPARPR